MNAQIEQMQRALRKYRSQAKATFEQLEKVYATYKPEEAQKEEHRLMGDLHQARTEAENTIYLAHKAATDTVKQWATLDGNQVTSDNTLLMTGMVSPEEFEKLVAKYQDNFTMSHALRNYAERMNKKIEADNRKKGQYLTAGPYQTKHIPDPKARLAQWDKFSKSCHTMLDQIDGHGLYGNAFMAAMANQTIDSQIDGMSKWSTM